MNFDHVKLRDVEGEHPIGNDELPLKIGTSIDCRIRLPGPGGAPLALFDLLDGLPFVQPVGDGTRLELNGEPLVTSTRLSNGDVLAYFGSEIHISTATDQLTLRVALEDSAYVTQPPVAEQGEVLKSEESIAPTAFRRATEIGALQVTGKRRPLRYIVGGALVFLLTASFLLFTSVSVEFEVDPASPDDFSISGGWFRLPVGDRVLLRKGAHAVNVSKAGYYDVSQSFVVGEEPSMTVRLRMRKKPGKLLVVTEPFVDAIVTVDETLVGSAPYGPVELEPGEHSIRIEAERFLPFEDFISVEGLNRTENIYAQLVPRWADVEVQSEPPGATIYSGDVAVGTTPTVVELLEGSHDLTVVKDGFAAWDGSVMAVSNVAQTLPTITLQPADAKLLVTTIPRGANVTVNGRYRGKSPLTISLSPEVTYEIGMSRAGYGVTNRSVRLESAASESITVDLSARVGTVTVNVIPTDAVIYVDGRSRGSGKTIVRLSSAPHRIEVKRLGYQDWSRTITPRPGYPQTVTAELRSLEAIKRDSVARVVKTPAGQTLHRVEGGTFTMGASRSENGRRANEVIRPVTITAPFFISIHEVTNKEFIEFRSDHDSGSGKHPALAADNNPVANVTWEEAVQYCNWLSKREGRTPVYREEFGKWVPVYPLTDGYRLPTEAEWVWALRYAERPQPLKFPWGERFPPPKNSGNYADRTARDLVPSIIPTYDDGYASTSEVGKFRANAIGLFDGGGNVAEWVNDWYTVPTPGITTPAVDPVGPERGTSHVIRGSSWWHAGQTELRMSYRDYGSERRFDVGFRLARNVD